MILSGMVFSMHAKIYSLLICATLCGCATLPKLGEAPTIRAPESLSTAQSFAAPIIQFPPDAWWTLLNDPALSGLIEEGLRKSPDVALVSSRVRAAEALVLQAGSQRSPQLAADASVGGEKLSQNRGFPPQFIPDNLLSEGRIAGSLSFDPDLWGKNRAALAAATSEAQATRVDAAQAALMLSTAIATAYGELWQYYVTRDVALSALRVRNANEALTAARVKNGLDTLGDLRLAQSRTAASRGEVGGIDEAIILSRNQIAALVGAGPDRGLSIARPMLGSRNELGLPENLSLNLLGRRPDLVAARLRAEVAASRIKVAKADFYPDIKFSAVAGLQSIGLDTLLKSTSTFATFGPAVSLPIFDGGAIAARYRGARANYDGAVAQYDATLVAAFHEVADVVARKRALVGRLADANASVAAAKDAQRIMALRYKEGLANQLQLLVAEDATINAERDAVRLRGLGVLLDLALVRAVGGGFEDKISNRNLK